jgi:hypothetical protein
MVATSKHTTLTDIIALCRSTKIAPAGFEDCARLAISATLLIERKTGKVLADQREAIGDLIITAGNVLLGLNFPRVAKAIETAAASGHLPEMSTEALIQMGLKRFTHEIYEPCLNWYVSTASDDDELTATAPHPDGAAAVAEFGEVLACQVLLIERAQKRVCPEFRGALEEAAKLIGRTSAELLKKATERVNRHSGRLPQLTAETLLEMAPPEFFATVFQPHLVSAEAREADAHEPHPEPADDPGRPLTEQETRAHLERMAEITAGAIVLIERAQKRPDRKLRETLGEMATHAGRSCFDLLAQATNVIKAPRNAGRLPRLTADELRAMPLSEFFERVYAKLLFDEAGNAQPSPINWHSPHPRRPPPR